MYVPADPTNGTINGSPQSDGDIILGAVIAIIVSVAVALVLMGLVIVFRKRKVSLKVLSIL